MVSRVVSRLSGVGPRWSVINGKKCDQINNSAAPQTSSVKHELSLTTPPPPNHPKRKLEIGCVTQPKFKEVCPIPSCSYPGWVVIISSEVQQDVAENHCEGWTCQTVSQCMQEKCRQSYKWLHFGWCVLQNGKLHWSTRSHIAVFLLNLFLLCSA